MTLDEIRKRHRQMDRCIRDGDIAGAERIAIELSPHLEKMYDELDDRGRELSWQCDK